MDVDVDVDVGCAVGRSNIILVRVACVHKVVFSFWHQLGIVLERMEFRVVLLLVFGLLLYCS